MARLEPKLTPCLWFHGTMEEAIHLYTSLFPDSSHNLPNDAAPGSVMLAEWTMLGLSFRGINLDSEFDFSEAISFSVTCEDQAETDRYWRALTADGGEESQCGWLKDKFGVSWQIVPKRLFELVSDPDPARAKAATDSMLTMRRIIVTELEEAVAGIEAS